MLYMFNWPPTLHSDTKYTNLGSRNIPTNIPTLSVLFSGLDRCVAGIGDTVLYIVNRPAEQVPDDDLTTPRVRKVPFSICSVHDTYLAFQVFGS